jgi:hypothetical protein
VVHRNKKFLYQKINDVRFLGNLTTPVHLKKLYNIEIWEDYYEWRIDVDLEGASICIIHDAIPVYVWRD